MEGSEGAKGAEEGSSMTASLLAAGRDPDWPRGLKLGSEHAMTG